MKNHYLLYILLLALMCSTASLAGNYVIINQVMYDTPLNEKTNISPYSNGEYIELYNAGVDTAFLQGWQLSGDGTSETITFSDAVQMPSQSYLIIACRRGATNTFQLPELYTLPNSLNYSIMYQNKIVLANSGETLTLCNAQNDTIDQMHYDGTSNPHRLYATNPDTVAGDSCVSLHRTGVEFDPVGRVVPEANQWTTARVSFAESLLPYEVYQEDFITGGQALSANENYVISITPLDPATRISFQEGRPSVSSGVRTHAVIQYMDGLGRTDETIALGVTPGKKDLVEVADYYDKRNIARQWLPVFMETEGQRINRADIHSQAQSYYDDSRPFAETQYENSSRKRPTKQIRPGASYVDNGAEQTYGLNEGSHVRIYTVVSDSILHTDGTYYGAGTLYKTTASDEDHKSVITYTDKQGRKIMEERNNSCTYYVYDDLGRLRFVLPNIPSSKLNNGNYALSNSTLKAMAYCYRYDNHGNMTYKRLPGCEPQYMVYNQAGLLVLKQDGNQRLKGEWTLCSYDTLGRNTSIEEIELAQSHSNLVTYCSDKWQVDDLGTHLRWLTINYYDDYEHVDDMPEEVGNALSFTQESGFDTPYDNTTGLLTGTWVYNLSEGGFTATVCYYDAQGRVIQSKSTRNAGGYISTSTEYLFDGSIAQQLTVQGTEDDLIREHYRYTYDHAGRVTNTYYQLNNDAEIKISEFSYDSIGRLAQKLLHNSKDTITYSYDIRNMLTESHNKHYSERLFYADNVWLFNTASPCHNGNISVSQIMYADSSKYFAYLYDQQNRLTYSRELFGYRFRECERYTYDNSGNIVSLQRYDSDRMIDNLSCSYGDDGHQLLSITDSGQDADLYSTIEYHNAATQADTTFRYDANGNLVCDLDRGISAIKYNILNLPDTIQFVNGNQIVNLYDAAGRKYKSITYTVPATAGTSHYEIEHYTFATDTVEYLATEYSGNIELCYTRTDTVTQRIHNAIGYYSDCTYYHYIKDHLGNVCAVVNSTADTTIQRTMYYASGVPMSQSWGRDKQPYLYNGQEFIEAPGWNSYDYGFRGYYATIGRFTSIDPLSEQTPWQSPYVYANNNFINNIDWMGLGGMTSFTDANIVNCIVVDIWGDVIGGANDGDNNIYVDLDGEWDATEGKGGLIWVCEMEHSYVWYMSRGIAALRGGGHNRFHAVSTNQIRSAISNRLIADVALGIADNFLRNYLNETIGPIGRTTTTIIANTRTIQNIYNIFDSFLTQGYNPQAAYDATKEILTIGVTALLESLGEKAVGKMIAAAPQIGISISAISPYILTTAGVAILGWGYYKMGKSFIDLYNSLDSQLNSKGFWANLGGFDYDGSDW